MQKKSVERKQLLVLVIQLVLVLGLQSLNIYTAQLERWAWLGESVYKFVLLFALVAARYQNKVRNERTSLLYIFAFFLLNLVVDLVIVFAIPSLF